MRSLSHKKNRNQSDYESTPQHTKTLELAAVTTIIIIPKIFAKRRTFDTMSRRSGQRSSRPGSRSIWPLIVYSAHPDEHPLCARWMAKKRIDFSEKCSCPQKEHLRDGRACVVSLPNSRIVPMCELRCVLFVRLC